MPTRPKIHGPVEQKLDELVEEQGFSGYNEAIRHILTEAGYDP